MSRVSMFNSPLLLGFEHFERALDRVSKTASDGYPPYNIERRGEDHLRITLAVAGFGAFSPGEEAAGYTDSNRRDQQHLHQRQ